MYLQTADHSHSFAPIEGFTSSSESSSSAPPERPPLRPLPRPPPLLPLPRAILLLLIQSRHYKKSGRKYVRYYTVQVRTRGPVSRSSDLLLPATHITLLLGMLTVAEHSPLHLLGSQGFV